MFYIYQAFGLNILSEIELPELLSGNREHKIDIHIRYGIVPKTLANAKQVDCWSQVKANIFQLNIAETARYQAIEGQEVIVHPIDNTEPINVRLYLLGTVFGAILHQRNIVPLHASAILVNGMAVAFTGDTGAGKSTMAACWHQRGYKIISDDVVALIADSTGNIMVYGGFPRIKLWQDAIDRLQIEKKNLTPDYQRMHKYQVMIDDAYQAEPVPLSSVILLESTMPSMQEELKQIKGTKAITTLLHNTYRAHFVADLSTSKTHFLACSKIAQKVCMYQLTRHWGAQHIEPWLDKLEQHWQDKEFDTT